MGSRPIIAALLALLGGIGAFVYTSPAAPPDSVRVAAGLAGASTSRKQSDAPAATDATAATSNAAPQGRDALDAGPSRPRAKVRTVVHTVHVTTPARRHSPGTPHCSSFTWQQDAQAEYVKNLDDPYGLDGAPGPANDDGIACSLLPVDPARPPSTPAGAAPPPPPPGPKPEGLPGTPSLEALLSPQASFFGVSTPQAPYDFKDLQIFAGAAKKLPNMVEFFAGWDQSYPRDQVIELWRRGALPVISWEPRPTVQPIGPDSDNTVEPGFSLSSIIDGSHDDYIDQFAIQQRDLGLPIAIRFAHEMNGNWFPWSEERNGNHRGEYVQAWRHVHDRFTALGATNVIWIWSPNVITGRPSVRLAPLYPGDDYVDWMGMVGYYRRLYLDDKGNPKAPTFDNTYSGTLDELRSVATKPIVITELGAVEVRQNKAEWIKSVFDGIAANPDIIGFIWFDHSVNGSDWRIESSDAAANAFAEGVAGERYGSGHPRRS